MKIIALLAREGGVGKTTIGIHMGVLDEAAGLRVIFFDLDPQRSLAARWQSRAGDTPALIETDACRLPGLLTQAKAEGFDVAVIDMPPAVSFETAQVAAAADLTLIPLRPSILDIYAVESTITIVRAARAEALLILNACVPPKGSGEAPPTTEARARPRDGRRAPGRGLACLTHGLYAGPQRGRRG